ncbi:oxidoreductase [Streptomyces regensis]|nr:oxidoreductase [Streptomyces regensis]
MRDLVEIGMGRTARRSYDFDDIDIVPSRRTRSSKVVSTAWQIDAYRFDLPLVTHPSDAVVSPHTAVEIGKLGGLGALNAEGLWARHADAESALAKVAEAAKEGAAPSEVVRRLQELHSAPVRPDLLTEAVRTVRDSGTTVAARVSPQHAAELTPHLLSAGVEILIVQGTIVSAEHVGTGDADGGDGADSDTEPLNLKDFIADLDVPVIAGGVSDYRTAMHLMRTGAAGVIVGHGYSPGVTTTDQVLGIGVPMATASAAAHPSLPRSRVARVAGDGGPVDSVDLRTLLHGPAQDPSGTVNLFGALRRALAKTGYSDLKEFQRVGLTVRH